MNLKDRFYVATIGSDAIEVAKEYGLGIEIDEFCTADNMDSANFHLVDKAVKNNIKETGRHILHAPFNELFPAAIDSKALELAFFRYNQAYELAKSYGIKRMVVHSGYVPFVYFKSWFSDRSIIFWREFMKDKPDDFQILIENVLEDEPDTLAGIIEKIGDERVRACLDFGHANVTTSLDLNEWLNTLMPYLGHLHIHNNDKTGDRHLPINEGTIEYNQILEKIANNSSKQTTLTIENISCRASVKWLSDNGWI